MATRRRSTISNAVLNSQRAEQMEYGSNHNSPIRQTNGGAPGVYEAHPPPSYQSPMSSAHQRSRYGMSSGGGPSSINIFNHDGQGSYGNPYEKPAGSVVAPPSFLSSSPFAGRPSVSREERYRLQQSSSSGVGNHAIISSNGGQPGLGLSTPSMSTSPSGPTNRSRLGQAGSSCIMGQSPSSTSLPLDTSLTSKRRGSSWGGGDSSNVASILSWSTNVSTPPTSSYHTSSPAGPSTSNDAYGYGLSSTPASSSKPPYDHAAAFDSPSPHNRPPAAHTPPYGMDPPPSIRLSRPPGGRSSWTPGWTF